MSWLTDLAGRAESLLEKVDKGAANVLHSETGEDLPLNAGERSNAQDILSHENRQQATETDNLVGRSSSPTKQLQRPYSASSKPARSAQSGKNDDQLFEFLNSSPAVGAKERRAVIRSSVRPTPPTTLSKTAAPVPATKDNVDGVDKTGITESHSSNSLREDALSAVDSEEVSAESASTPASPDAPPTAPPQRDQEKERQSNLELENKLLRKEVASLNEELVAVVQRSKDVQEEVINLQRQMEKTRHQMSQSENIVRQCQGKEDDLNSAIAAKDSQLAVLRVRLQEVDQELKTKTATIAGLQEERNQILKDHTDSSGVHNQALDTLRRKLEDTEAKLKGEQDTHRKLQEEAIERQNKLEEEQESMAESLKSLQKKYNEEKKLASESATALRIAKSNLEASKQELKDYKDKAARILQAKEKVIASLKDGGAVGDPSAALNSAEFEELIHERDMIKEELNQTRFKLEQIKADIQEMEMQQQSEADLAQEQLQSLESSLADERQRREEAEKDALQYSRDLQFSNEENLKQKTNAVTQLQEKDTEIQRLKNQLAARSAVSTSEMELENRVRVLTENLIQKQTLIEALSTEKNSLVLQLERLEQQYRDVQMSTTKLLNERSTHVHVMEDSDDSYSRNSISSIIPSKLRDSRRVKTAVNEIDKFSIRLGVFLRRYPVARLFVLLYMALLHMWVMIVLLTYQPEIHPDIGNR